MRHIVYSLATFALVANGASTSTSSTVSSPPMAPAVPAVPATPAVPAAPAAPAAPSAPQSGSPQLEVPIIPTLEPVGASASGSAGGASGSASGSAGGGMGSGGASASGSANANAGNAEAGAGAGASASSGETTSAPPATTSAPPATTSAPDGTATAVPASGDSTTAGPGDTSATTSSPGGTATAVPAGPADATAPPAADTTAAPPADTTAAPAETTSSPAETTAAPNDGATAAPADNPNANGLTGPTASIDTPAALTKGALVPPAGFLPNVLPDGIATVSNLIPGPLVGYLDNAWVRNWNSIWTGTWWGTLIGYGNVNLPLLGPLNIYAPQTLSSWTLGNPENRYGPGWGAGTMVYPALSAQKWWSSGHRFSWSFLPLPTIPGWTFSSEMRGCILNEIEKRIQIYDTRIAPGWLVPGSGNPVATDIAWGYTNAVYWLSWVLPFGAPNTPISNKNYVAPILSILKTPEFYSAIENGCHIPFSNFTVLSKEIKYQGNSWATTDTRVDMTEPIVGAAPSSFSPFQIMAIPFLSLAALLRGN